MDNDYLGGEGLRNMAQAQRQAPSFSPEMGASLLGAAPVPQRGELERAVVRLQNLRQQLQSLNDEFGVTASQIGAGHIPVESKPQAVGNGPDREGHVPILHCELDIIAQTIDNLHYQLQRFRTL